MFKFLMICAIVGLAAALPTSDERHAEEVKRIDDVKADGFDHVLDTSNDIHRNDHGDEHGNIHGSFSWISPEGEHIKIDYVADENGYQPQSDVLPIPPPTPEAILKALEYINAHPSAENYNH